MSQDRVFTIIGDSNVRRFVTEVNKRACPDIGKAQILSCGKLSLLADSLLEVQPSSNVCILSCVSNFICDAPPGSASASVRVDSVISDFRKYVHVACSTNPSKKFLVCPPMYRRSPLWYRDGIGEILNKFSSMMSSEKPANLQILPSFSRPEFDPDGVHLTPYSGLEFLFHLFDSSGAVLDLSKKKPEQRQEICSEAVRALEDRMMANEQDHKRLNASFEAKVAVDAELADFQENVRNEVYFVVSGLPRISQELRGRDWQARAASDVRGLIHKLLKKELPIVVVQNITGRGSDAITRYHVRMEFAAHSQEIRSAFGSFFIGGVDRRPPEFKEISISNRVTPGTQVRIAILRLLGKRYVTSNPGAKSKVIGFESRPILRLTPPENSSDKRVQTYTYIEAIRRLPTCFSKEEVQPILSKIDPKFRGKLRSTFVVLCDDDFQESRSSRKRARDTSAPDGPDPKR